MVDDDERVAGTVAAWERGHSLEKRDWRAIGIAERNQESPR